MKTKNRLRTALLTVLVLAGVSGAVSSSIHTSRLRKLEKEHQRLSEVVGAVEVSDPDRVHISAVPANPNETLPGVTSMHVWRFNVYLPPQYGRCLVSKRGEIAADSPRSTGGSGSSWASKQKESQEFQMSVALLKTDTGWLLARTGGGGGGSSNLPKDIDYSNLDSFVVEPVVSPGEKTLSFGSDEAICLLRLRGKEAVKPRKGYPPLYRGNAVYLLESDRRGAFDDWATGRTDQMAEVDQ